MHRELYLPLCAYKSARNLIFYPSGLLQHLSDCLRFFFAGSKLTQQDLLKEKELVQRARHDPAVFGELYEQNYDRILNYVIRRTASVEVAQDITAEVFLKAFKGIAKFTWQNVPFQAWLYRIALHEVALWHRKQPYAAVSLSQLRESGFDPRSEQDVEEEILAAEAELERHKDFLLLQNQMNELPAKYREVLFLRFFAELPLQDIALVLNKPVGTIKSLLHRGIEKLQHMTILAKNSATKSPDQHYKV